MFPHGGFKRSRVGLVQFEVPLGRVVRKRAIQGMPEPFLLVGEINRLGNRPPLQETILCLGGNSERDYF